MIQLLRLVAISVALLLVACSDSTTVSDNEEDMMEQQMMEQQMMEQQMTEQQMTEQQTGDPGDTPPVVETNATYRITFDASWSSGMHPVQFPAGAHFSGLVGAVHNEQVIFWEAGQIATDGIELMAETGAKSILLDEVDSAINSGYALAEINGGGIATSPGAVSVEVMVTPEYPIITLTTMLAPSPDWFTGFHGVRLFENNVFIDSLVIDGFVYDSGTDSGITYASSNSDTQPREVISRLTSESGDSSFVNGLPIAGQFTIERL